MVWIEANAVIFFSELHWFVFWLKWDTFTINIAIGFYCKPLVLHKVCTFQKLYHFYK